MEFVCVKCGHANEVSLKAKDGEGRRDAHSVKRLNYLKKKILALFVSDVFKKPVDNDELTDYVVGKVKKVVRGKVVGNYTAHDRKVVMTEVSFLLGLNLLSLIKENNPSLANPETYEWHVKGYRGYHQTKAQKARATEILERDGYIDLARWERAKRTREAKERQKVGKAATQTEVTGENKAPHSDE